MIRQSHLATTFTIVLCSLLAHSNVHADWQPAFPELLLPGKGLTKKTTRQLERGIAAVRNCRWSDAHNALQPLLESSSPSERWDIDYFLALSQMKRKIDDLVVDARLNSLKDNKNLTRRAGPVELSLLLPTMGKELDETIKPAREELEIAHQLNMPHAVMDIKSNTLIRMMTQTEEARLLLSSLKTIATKIDKATMEMLAKSCQAIAKRNFVEEDRKLMKMHDELLERLVELNMSRLTDNVTLLSSSKAPYEARFTAALRAGDAISVLNNHWNSFKRRKNKGQGLTKVRNLEEQWRSQERTYTTKVGKLRDKAYHFEEGKKWWLRARYGRAHFANGFVKLIPSSGSNSEVAMLYYPLEMPDPIPKPTHPINKPEGSPVARRHMWLADYSTVDPSANPARNRFLANRIREAFPNEKLPERLPDWIDADPKSLRWVGYLEYQMALYHFGKLAEMVSAAESESIDQWIAKDDRMIVASGLSTRYDAVPLVKSSSIQFYGQRIEDPRATFPYERRGLSWVMALAQIELGAMRACRIDLDIPFNGIDAAALTKGDPHAASDLTYTGADLINLATGGSAGRVPNPNGKLDLLNPKNLAGAQRASVVPIQLDVIYRDRLGPFHRFRPNDSSRTAFHELLYDGARQQYYSLRLNLQIDPQRQIGVEPRAGDQIGNALSLIKRTTIAIEFLLALRDEMSSSLTARQKLELDDWENYLTTARSFFARTALNAYANAKAEQLRLNYNPRQDAALQAAPTPSKKSTNTKKSTNSNSTKGK